MSDLPNTPATPTSSPSLYEQLNEKQRAFVDAICLDPNISAAKAAQAAGCPKAGSRVQGHRLLTNDNVRKALGERLKDTAPSTEEIARRWDRVSQATLEDFFTKKQVAVENQIEQPLAEAITQLKAEMAFEAEVAARSNLDSEEQKAYQQATRRRERQLVRWEVELEQNPLAFRLVAGPPTYEEVLTLDLVKAKKRGVLDLAKSIKPTQFGTSVELRDADAALDKLARMSGAYEKDNAQSRPDLSRIEITIRQGRSREERHRG
jgi:phage terminase small subunit